MDSEEILPNIDELPDRMARLEMSAFHAFAREFGPRFRAYFLRRSLPISEAEDLADSCVQDISLKVARSQFASQGPRSFEKWVFTLLHHAFVDWLRTRKPATFRSVDDLDLSVFGTETNPNEAVCAAVEQVLEHFSEKDRTILSLRDMESEYTYEEIGQLLGMSDNAVRVQHHRILKRLERLLTQHPTISTLLNNKEE